MRQAPSKFITTLISEEIRRLVADAIADGNHISTDHAADAIMRTYPNSGVTEAEIVNEIAWAAARAGIAVEFGARRIAA